jgi:hypothetical protein
MRGPAPSAERVTAVHRVAAGIRNTRTRDVARVRSAIRVVADVARATLVARAAQVAVELEAGLQGHDESGTPPPLLTLARRSTDEKPYNAYLGWIFDPAREHAIGKVALARLAQALGFDAVVRELEAPDVDVEVRCESPWPDGARSSKEPDLLVFVPRSGPRALLLIENKLLSGESGDQYGSYRRALDALGNRHGIPVADRRCYLLAPDGRAVPEGWSGSLLHADLARLLEEVSRDERLPNWDRALCFLVAEAFLHERSASARIAEARRLLKQLRLASGPSQADVRRACELLPLPRPFRWRSAP